MANTSNKPTVLAVEFYRTIVVVHFTSGYWTYCKNAYKYKHQGTTHINWAINWIKKYWVDRFMVAQNKLIQAWLVEKIVNKWAYGWWMDRWMLRYSEWTTPAKRDYVFTKPVWLFA